MKVSSNDLYTSGEYYTNNHDWDIVDAKWKTEVIFKLLQNNNITPKDVTEIGCGAGENLVELAKRDDKIKTLAGFDISPQAIALAEKKST